MLDFFDEKYKVACKLLLSLSRDWQDSHHTDDHTNEAILYLLACGLAEIQFKGECWVPGDRNFPKHYFNVHASGFNWKNEQLRQVKKAVVGLDGPGLAVQNDLEKIKVRLTLHGVSVWYQYSKKQIDHILEYLSIQYPAKIRVRITGIENSTKEVLKKGPYAEYGSEKERQRVHQEWIAEANRIRDETPLIKASDIIRRLQRSHSFTSLTSGKAISDKTIRRVISK